MKAINPMQWRQRITRFYVSSHGMTIFKCHLFWHWIQNFLSGDFWLLCFDHSKHVPKQIKWWRKNSSHLSKNERYWKPKCDQTPEFRQRSPIGFEQASLSMKLAEQITAIQSAFNTYPTHRTSPKPYRKSCSSCIAQSRHRWFHSIRLSGHRF